MPNTDRLQAFISGVKDCAGLPAVALASALIGYGAIARESGLDLAATVLSVLTIWALPPLITFTEVYASGGGPLVMLTAILIVNMRTLPLVVAALPLIRHETGLRVKHFLYGQLISPSSWAQLQIKGFELAPQDRESYFVGFGLLLLAGGVIGAAFGFTYVGDMPQPIALSLLLLTPLFVCMIMTVANSRSDDWAVFLGVVAVPAAMEWSHSWGMLIGGVGAGTAGFVIGRQWRHREAEN
ncbi:MAG: AzlC family ABC transporter permease [Pseudomonadota bacterium]|nr:AzlC family ABC transporter permease [Pseudomonadota bacterium]